jgi:hypothetical protein
MHCPALGQNASYGTIADYWGNENTDFPGFLPSEYLGLH